MSEHINLNTKFHLNPLEIEIQERQKGISNLSECSMKEIDKVIGLQHCMGMHKTSVDNLGHREINLHTEDLLVEKQDAYKNNWKKGADYGTAFLHILGGCLALGGIEAGYKAVTAFAGAGQSYSGTLNSSEQVNHTRIDGMKETNQMRSGAMRDDASRTKQQNESLLSVLQQYYRSRDERINSLSR